MSAPAGLTYYCAPSVWQGVGRETQASSQIKERGAKRDSFSPSRSLTDLFLQGGCLTDGGPGQDPGVGETGPQQAAHDEEEEDGSDDGDGERQLAGQEGTAGGRGEREREMSRYPEGSLRHRAAAPGRCCHPRNTPHSHPCREPFPEEEGQLLGQGLGQPSLSDPCAFPLSQ